MVDYTKITSQGQTVEKVYLCDGGISVLIAIVKKKASQCVTGEGPYFWAYAYHLEDGTWGQGHYYHNTAQSAIRAMKKEYPQAKPVDPRAVITVVNKAGSFGKYTDMLELYKRLYRIAKARGDAKAIRMFNDTVVCYAYKEGNAIWMNDYENHRLVRLLSTGEVRY